MSRIAILEVTMCAVSFPVAIFLAHEGHTGALWLCVALVAGLGATWVLQGLFRKSK
jgi:hypothetical protein